MADIAYWEKVFVERFIVKDKRERYLMFLKGRKHRKKVLDRLNHNLDFEPSLAKDLKPIAKSKDDLLALLKSKHVSETCYLMAFQNEHDGKELRLELGVDELFGNHWGAVLICPPKPIAIYKQEDIGGLFLLSENTLSWP